ncbi:hypothetical protein SAMN05421882_100189 [Nitrosomonas communis]|uniref:Uncharacterized protein n=1 Tax=Nitrosomonas communis TaxID=44574 RepID=A0A1H2PXQ9_9PROT|nr:hypothetical protein SAMN05421882_100189 [Nitrosomonas communis]
MRQKVTLWALFFVSEVVAAYILFQEMKGYLFE